MSKPIRLIHIAPELPPAVGGVADYTAILSRRLVEVSDGCIEPTFIHAGKQPADAISGEFPVVDVSGKCSSVALAEAIEQVVESTSGPSVVLLEYSGYGYAKRGAPLWLARGLRQVCGGSGPPLLVMFHEVRARSWKPWSSTFWLSPVQSHVARRLADVAAGGCSNRVDSVEWLRTRSSAAIRHCPVFSNVGEPGERRSYQDREPSAVVFGGTGKNALYRDHGGPLTQLLQAAGIRTLVDIGPRPSHSLLPSTPDVDTVCKGPLPVKAVSRHLQTARLGLVCRNPAALTKSGSLAAYLAHGLPAVVALRHSSENNAHLTDGVHYLSLQRALEEAPDDDQWEAIGNKGWTWYNEYAHSHQAALKFLELIARTGSTSS